MGIWILVAVILGLLVYFMSKKSFAEPFQNVATNVSSYSHLRIRKCPADSTVVQTSKGFTDCCKGEFLDGKCRGETVGTLSPPHDGVPSVTEYWRKYFESQATNFCPSTMPNYYENSESGGSGIKGCADTKSLANGSKSGVTKRSCQIYDGITNYKQADSCLIEKMRATQKCPPAQKMTAKVGQGSDPTGVYIYCSGTDNNRQPFICYQDESLWQYLRLTPTFQTSFEDFKKNSAWSDSLCSNFESAQANRLKTKLAAEDAARKQAVAEQAQRDLQTKLDAANNEKTALLAQVKNCRR